MEEQQPQSQPQQPPQPASNPLPPTPPQPVAPAPAPAPSKSGKRIVLIIVSILVVAALSVVAYLAFKSSDTDKTDPNTAAVGETEEDPEEAEPTMKVYDNPLAGFRFSYPDNWTLTEETFIAEEGGTVLVTTPSGLKLSISQNIGGKGGACDEDPTDKPHDTANCSTLEILSKEKLATKAKNPETPDIYLFEVKHTAARKDGVVPASSYNLYLSNNTYEIAATEPLIGAWTNEGIIYNGMEEAVPYINTRLVEGELTNPDVLNSADFAALKELLKSFEIK